MYAFRPEPEPAEREALLLALERLLDDEKSPSPYRSEWRRAALEEGISEDEEDDSGP
jgi:hypothetical protein